MLKTILTAFSIIFILASCSSIKPVSFSNNRQVASVGNQEVSSEKPNEKREIRFLEEIAVSPSQTTITTETRIQSKESGPSAGQSSFTNKSAPVEAATPLQLKYAVLLNTEVEQIEDTELLRQVDEWYGTRYRMGGTTRKGIDCSAFVQNVYLAAFAHSVPRTAFEQYKAASRISATELREGDLVFFNTTGGVSHVGIYLRNNKFIHASSSNGVTVSDLFDPYYLKRFLGAGRITRPVTSKRN